MKKSRTLPVEVGQIIKVKIERQIKDSEKGVSGVAYIGNLKISVTFGGPIYIPFRILVPDAKVGEECKVRIIRIYPESNCAFAIKSYPKAHRPEVHKIIPSVELQPPLTPMPEVIPDAINPQCELCEFLRNNECQKGLYVLDRGKCHGFHRKL